MNIHRVFFYHDKPQSLEEGWNVFPPEGACQTPPKRSCPSTSPQSSYPTPGSPWSSLSNVMSSLIQSHVRCRSRAHGSAATSGGSDGIELQPMDAAARRYNSSEGTGLPPTPPFSTAVSSSSAWQHKRRLHSSSMPEHPTVSPDSSSETQSNAKVLQTECTPLNVVDNPSHNSASKQPSAPASPQGSPPESSNRRRHSEDIERPRMDSAVSSPSIEQSQDKLSHLHLLGKERQATARATAHKRLDPSNVVSVTTFVWF